jgi:hypothetical protein
MSIANLPDQAANRPKAKYEDDPEAEGVPISPWEQGDQAENELRWLFCQSGGELGEHSAWNALVTMAQVGGHQGTRLEPYIEGEVTAPVPTRRQIWAAERQNRYRAALRKLPAHHVAVLERKYSNGRPNAQIKGLLAQQDAEAIEPVVTYLIDRGEVRFKIDGTDKELPGIIQRAQKLLDEALSGYREARGHVVVMKGNGPNRERRGPVELVAAGVGGASKRRLVAVEAPRKSRP